MRTPKSTLAALLFAGIAITGFIHFVHFRSASYTQAPHLVLHRQSTADLAFRTLDNQPLRLASFKGKVVLVNSWGTWCLPCRAEMPTFERLYTHYRNDPQVAFVMIANRDTAAEVRAYALRNQLDLPLYLEEPDAIPLSTDFRQFPTTSIYAPDGTLAASQIGPADWSDPTVIAFIDALKSN